MQQKDTSNHVVIIKNRSSDLPTFELKCKEEHATCETALKDGVARLVNVAADKIRKKLNPKVDVGVECIIVKPRGDE